MRKYRFMRLIVSLITSVIFISNSYAQTCFYAYDLMFTDDNASLPYREFHKLELDFLDNLKGCDAIDFNTTNINDKELILSELKGKIIVLNFWFTTCMPCLKEIPELNKLVDKNDADDVVFIGFARDDKDRLLKFFNKFGEFKYIIVPESYAIADMYKVVAWPQSMVIDRNGKVYKSWAGLGEGASELVAEIQTAMEECQSNETATIQR